MGITVVTKEGMEDAISKVLGYKVTIIEEWYIDSRYYTRLADDKGMIFVKGWVTV